MTSVSLLFSDTFNSAQKKGNNKINDSTKGVERNEIILSDNKK